MGLLQCQESIFKSMHAEPRDNSANAVRAHPVRSEPTAVHRHAPEPTATARVRDSEIEADDPNEHGLKPAWLGNLGKSRLAGSDACAA